MFFLYIGYGVWGKGGNARQVLFRSKYVIGNFGVKKAL